MSAAFASQETVLAALRAGIILVGGLVWWAGLRRSPNPGWHTLRLPTWWISGVHFSYLAFGAILGWFVGSVAANEGMSHAFPKTAQDTELTMVVIGTMSEFGVVVGLTVTTLLLRRTLRADAPTENSRGHYDSPISLGKALLAGLVTYVAAVPTVMLVALGWQALLDYLHIPRPLQDSVALFGATHDPVKIGLLGTAAVVIAPIAEELVFRAGLFRFLRTRLPPRLAFLIPALLFGAAHANLSAFLPLVVLAIVLSLAYERTGQIATTMVAHALFNLTSIALILWGVDL